MGTKGGLFKVLSVGLAFATGAQGVVWAAPIQPAAVVPAGPRIQFTLPASVASVQDRHAAGKRLVVLIQDAHTNESGQMNLARALDRILSAENIDLLFTEGADSDVTPDALKVGDLSIREKVGQNFLRKGLLNGGEYLSMTSDRDFRIVGAEDISLYHQAGRLFRDAAAGRRAALQWLDRVSRVLGTLKTDLWTGELRALDSQRERYRSGDLPLTNYFDQLASAARAHKIAVEAYPDLMSLLELRDRENRVDFKRAGEEEVLAIKTLPAAVREELTALQKTYSPFKRSGSREEGSEGFFATLQSALIAADAQSAAKYPALFDYFAYVSDSRRLNAAGVLKELGGLESAVWNAMSVTAEARQLGVLIENVARMQRISELQASPEDFEAYVHAADAHDPKSIAGWINQRIADLKKHYDQAVLLDHRFDAPFASAVNFYQINSRRDAVMVDRMLERMDTDGADRAAIVTGGYHTPNLERLLRARGVSYVSVLPQVLFATDTDRYERLVREALEGIERQDLVSGVATRVDSAASSGWMLPPVTSRSAAMQAISSALVSSGQNDTALLPLSGVLGARMANAQRISQEILAAQTEGPTDVLLSEGRILSGPFSAVDPVERTAEKTSLPTVQIIVNQTQTFTEGEYLGLRTFIPAPPPPPGAGGGSGPGPFVPWMRAAQAAPPIILKGVESTQTWSAAPDAVTTIQFGPDPSLEAAVKMPALTPDGSGKTTTSSSGVRLEVLQNTSPTTRSSSSAFVRLSFARPNTTLPLTSRVAVRWVGPSGGLQRFNFGPVRPRNGVAGPIGAGPIATSPVVTGARMSTDPAAKGFTIPLEGDRASFNGIGREFGLDLIRIMIQPLNGAAEAKAGALDYLDTKGSLDDSLSYAALVTSAYMALAAYGFTGLGVTDAIKTAADGAAVTMGERSFVALTQANPNLAIVVFADEGRKDGSVSQPLRTIYYNGSYKTEQTNIDMRRQIASLQREGVHVVAFLGDAIDNTRGLVNPNALKKPGDSVSIVGFVPLDNNHKRVTPFLVPDEALRIGGVTLSLPTSDPDVLRRVEDKLTPFSGPSEIIKVLQAELGAKFDPNRVSFVTLGSGQKQRRHQHMIDEAAALQEQFPGLEMITIPDGDPLPRIMAGIGGKINQDRQWIVIGRGGSTENVLVLHTLKALQGSAYVHTLTSPSGSDERFAADNPNIKAWTEFDGENEGEADVIHELAVPKSLLDAPKLTTASYAPGLLAISSITGATPHYRSMQDLFHRVTFTHTRGQKSGRVTVRAIFTQMDGSAFAADLEFNMPDYYRTRGDLMSAGIVGRTHLDGLQEGILEKFDRIISLMPVKFKPALAGPIAEAQRIYLDDELFLKAADQVEALYEQQTGTGLFDDASYEDDWKTLIGMLRGKPAEGARLASTATVTHVGGDIWRYLTFFASEAILAGSVTDGSKLPVRLQRGGLAVLKVSQIKATTANVGIEGGLTATVRLDDAKAARVEQRTVTGSTANIAPAVQSAVQVRENDRKEAIDAIAGHGWIDAYFRVPLGSIFPEMAADPKTGELKANLTDEQIRAEIQLLLLDLGAFTGTRENGRRITFYLDPENLNPANRAWLQNILVKMPDLHVLSEKDPLPQDRVVFNWYVDQEHKDWRTDENAARHVITGSHLRLAPTRPGIAQRWSLAIRTPIEAFFAAVPDASTSDVAQNADTFVRAESFKDGAEFWQHQHTWFHTGAIFRDAAELLTKFQGSEMFLPTQVASYTLFKDIGEWADFVRQMRRRTMTSV